MVAIWLKTTTFITKGVKGGKVDAMCASDESKVAVVAPKPKATLNLDATEPKMAKVKIRMLNTNTNNQMKWLPRKLVGHKRAIDEPLDSESLLGTKGEEREEGKT